MFAIQDTKTGKWVYGTDFRYNPPHQRTSNNRVMIWDSVTDALFEYKRRKCGKKYKVAELKPLEIERYV